MNNYLPDLQLTGRKKIVVGMSGGVDSSVAALLLKRMGHEVIGLFMKNWDEPNGPCPAENDFADVARVCEKLDIPFYPIEFVQEYQDSVFAHFLKEYQAGHTPNPDILCNREIKFKVFFQKAMELGADYLATGHYAQHALDSEGRHLMKKGVDAGKDQTYFLCTMDEDILAKVLFPVGHLPKKEVRRLAEEAGLSTMHKKDSTGICFIGERPFKSFLANYLKPSTGKILHLNGVEVGVHQGHQFYTIGQRKGLGLGGQGDAWFVVDKNMEKNEVYVERGELHPALFSEWLVARELTFVQKDFVLQAPLECKAKIRYRQADQDCVLHPMVDGSMKVEFKTAQRAIAKGQAVVFYVDDVCLGGGFIREVAPSLYHQANMPKHSNDKHNQDLTAGI